MALTVKLDIRQGQQLVMTPQLQQAIRLLQLSNIELTQYVETELERNPLLERDDTMDGPAEGTGEAMPNNNSDDVKTAEKNGQDSETALSLDKPVADPSAELDTEFDNVYPDASSSDASQDSGWASLRPQTRNFSDDNNSLSTLR